MATWKTSGGIAYTVEKNGTDEVANLLDSLIENNIVGEEQFTDELLQWLEKIETANRNNILCHCRRCGWEWVDFQPLAAICQCGSSDVERISCWQFPENSIH